VKARGSGSDYFVNHRRARFDFKALYHRPIEMNLERFLQSKDTNAHVMVFGCGLFHESHLFNTFKHLALVDSDERLKPSLLHFVQAKTRTLLFSKTSQELLKVALKKSLDVIVAKEVIEHLEDANAYWKAFFTLLKPGGQCWVSTPNYGGPLLPFLERTGLEFEARLRGFSRSEIHPNKYSEEGLRRELLANGFVDVRVQKTPGRLALCAQARRPWQ